jgi:hypothetical protein
MTRVFAGPKFADLQVRVSNSHDQRTCILELLEMLSEFEKAMIPKQFEWDGDRGLDLSHGIRTNRKGTHQ